VCSLPLACADRIAVLKARYMPLLWCRQAHPEAGKAQRHAPHQGLTTTPAKQPPISGQVEVPALCIYMALWFVGARRSKAVGAGALLWFRAVRPSPSCEQ
jgi:hypothetical protein